MNQDFILWESLDTNKYPDEHKKLCRRILDDDPGKTILCTQKSKVVMDFELILVVKFVDNTFDVLTLNFKQLYLTNRKVFPLPIISTGGVFYAY